MWGNFHVVYRATGQQHHLKVEQICCQVACGLSDVKPHPMEDRIWKKICVASVFKINKALLWGTYYKIETDKIEILVEL